MSEQRCAYKDGLFPCNGFEGVLRHRSRHDCHPPFMACHPFQLTPPPPEPVPNETLVALVKRMQITFATDHVCTPAGMALSALFDALDASAAGFDGYVAYERVREAAR